SGAQQAIDLSLRLLIDPGAPVWVEDPGSFATRAALVAAGANLIPVPVDGDGLMVHEGIARAPKASAVYVTPSHQFPTGSVMSMSRRLDLIA
ncbi:PLP-dependent aminotransferase family protein, partial [Acinetobacter baumannii]